MTQLSPVNAAASRASTSRPVGVRLTETSTLAFGIPAETKAERSASWSGLGLPATRFFNVVSTVAEVATTAGSTAAVACAVAEGGGVVPGWAVDAGDAVQPVIMTVADTASDNAAPRIFAAFADWPSVGAVPLLIT